MKRETSEMLSWGVITLHYSLNDSNFIKTIQDGGIFAVYLIIYYLILFLIEHFIASHHYSLEKVINVLLLGNYSPTVIKNVYIFLDYSQLFTSSLCPNMSLF